MKSDRNPMDYTFTRTLTDSQKLEITSWIKNILSEVTGNYADCEDVFLEYVIVMISNRKSMKHISEELVAFVGESASLEFVNRLSDKLMEIESSTTQPQAASPRHSIQSKVVNLKTSSRQGSDSQVSSKENGTGTGTGVGTNRLIQSALRSTMQPKQKKDSSILEEPKQLIVVAKPSSAKRSAPTTADESAAASGKRQHTLAVNSSGSAAVSHKQPVVISLTSGDVRGMVRGNDEDHAIMLEKELLTSRSGNGAKPTQQLVKLSSPSAVTAHFTTTEVKAQHNQRQQPHTKQLQHQQVQQQQQLQQQQSMMQQAGMNMWPGMGMGMGMGTAMDQDMLRQQMNAYAMMCGFPNAEEMMLMYQQNMMAMMAGAVNMGAIGVGGGGGGGGGMAGLSPYGFSVANSTGAGGATAHSSRGRGRGRGGGRGYMASGAPPLPTAPKPAPLSTSAKVQEQVPVSAVPAPALVPSSSQTPVEGVPSVLPESGTGEGGDVSVGAGVGGRFGYSRGGFRGRGPGRGAPFAAARGRFAAAGRGAGRAAAPAANLKWVRPTDMDSALTCGR